MPRPKLGTTARGLGHRHAQRRAIMLPEYLGTLCPCVATTCRHHKGRPCRAVLTSKAELDHGTPRALGGAEGTRFLCPSCNRSLGAVLGNRLRGLRRRRTMTPIVTTTRTSRRW